MTPGHISTAIASHGRDEHGRWERKVEPHGLCTCDQRAIGWDRDRDVDQIGQCRRCFRLVK